MSDNHDGRSGPRIPRPSRSDDVLWTYRANRPLNVRKPTEQEAKDVFAEVNSATRWLNKHETDPETRRLYDFRCRPKVKEFYRVDGKEGPEFPAEQVTWEMLLLWGRQEREVEHYWVCSFHAMDPQVTGFGTNPEAHRAALEHSVRARGVSPIGHQTWTERREAKRIAIRDARREAKRTARQEAQRAAEAFARGRKTLFHPELPVAQAACALITLEETSGRRRPGVSSLVLNRSGSYRRCNRSDRHPYVVVRGQTCGYALTV